MRVLAIPDLHAPFVHPAAFRFVRSLSRRYRPHAVVFLGDLIDAHASGRFDRETAAPGPDDELDAILDALRPFYRAFPAARVCIGNHDRRPYAAAARAGVAERWLRNFRDVIDAPKTWTFADEHNIDNVTYVHGDGFSGQYAALNAARSYRGNVVIGHIHAWAGVLYNTGRRNTIWGCSAGCLIDPTAPVFNYGKYHPNRPTLGAVIIDNSVPTFHPL